MKKLLFFIIIAFTFQATLFSQGCLPDGIVFETQEQIDNFQTNYPGCTEIEGDVTIGKLWGGADITNLSGLNVLTYIEGYLEILTNEDLASLAGLDNLISVGGIRISANESLASLTGLDNVTSIRGYLRIDYNMDLANLTALDNVSSIEGYLRIQNNESLTSLAGLNNVTSIGGSFIISTNNALTSLVGLENLTSIGHYVGIQFNESMTSLSGLDNLTTVEGSFSIVENQVLTSLTALENLTSIGEYIYIGWNGTLTSLTALNNLTSIGGFIEIGNNDALINLSGLDNIEAASIGGLSIYYNPLLSSCEVLSVCNYLANPGGGIVIYDNAIGCNSQEEVEEACVGVSVPDRNADDEFSIYPNPAKDYLSISHHSGVSIEEIIIYNQMGQKVFEEERVNGNINISTLPRGIYVIEIRTDEYISREKLIIKE